MPESMSRKIARNALVLSGARYFNILLRVIVDYYFYNRMSVGFVDRYQIVFAIIALFGYVSEMGYDLIILREYSKPQADKRKILFNGLLIRIGLCSLSVLLCCAVAGLSDIPQGLRNITYVFSLHLFLLVWPVFQIPFKEKDAYVTPTLMANGFGAASLIILLLLAALQAPLIYFFFFHFLIEGLKLLAIWVYYRKKSPVRMHLAINWKIIRNVINVGAPAAVFFALNWVSLKVDQIMIFNLYKQEGALANYSLGIKISELVILIITTVTTVTVPVWAKYAENEPERLLHMVKRLQKYASVILMPVAWFFICFSDELLYLLFKHKYSGTGTVLPWLAVGSVFLSYYIIAFFFSFSCRKEKGLWIPSLGAAVLNIVLNLILLPRYGILGAAIATCASYCAGYIGFLLFRHLRAIMLDNLIRLWPPLLVSAVLILPVSYLNWPWWVLIGSAALYLPLLYFVKYFDKEDIVIVRSILAKSG